MDEKDAIAIATVHNFTGNDGLPAKKPGFLEKPGF
jgi:hypothetical protein